ncbi:MAG: helix-turn-helix domain-containing protein [Ignavibacteriales bacterium]
MLTKEVMTVKEVAEYLQISEASVRRMLKAKKLPAFKLGQQWRFRKNIVDKWMDENSIHFLQDKNGKEARRR